MIARIWTARATAAAAPRYVDYFNASVVPELRAIDGYEGAKVLVREQGQQHEVIVITWWTSFSAIRRFAGDAPEVAVVHEAAAALLSDFDPDVKHYAVKATDEPFPQTGH